MRKEGKGGWYKLKGTRGKRKLGLMCSIDGSLESFEIVMNSRKVEQVAEFSYLRTCNDARVSKGEREGGGVGGGTKG